MDVMSIFNVVIIGFGIFMVYTALKMHRTQKVSSLIVSQVELDKCKDEAGFVAFIYWKEALLGAVIVLVGVLGLINDFVCSLGYINLVIGIAFFIAFLWFQHELRKAREKFL